MLSFSGIADGNEINGLSLQWGSKTEDKTGFEMQNTVDITSLIESPKNRKIEIELTGTLIPLVNCINSNPDCMYRIRKPGTPILIFHQQQN